MLSCTLFSPVRAQAGEPAQSTWQRLSGPTALDTMVEVVHAGEFDTGGTVVLASADGYWDALSASGIAGLLDAPVLMTNGASLSKQTAALLGELAPSRIIVCGGTNSISDTVMEQARKAARMTSNPVRIADKNAALTAAAVVSRAASLGQLTWGDTAFVCSDEGFWDALSAAPVAYRAHFPIVLTGGGGTVPTATVKALKAQGVKQVYIVGGKDSVSERAVAALEAAGMTVAGRLWGDNAVETSEAVASFALAHCDMSASNLGVATVATYHDALSGAALCGSKAAPIVLVDGERSHIVSNEGFVATEGASIETGYVFGGEASVGAGTMAALAWAQDPSAVALTRKQIEQAGAGELAGSGPFYRQSEAALIELPQNASQVIVVHSRADKSCAIALHEIVDGVWRQTYASEGTVGRSGVGTAHESSAVTPRGVFGLGFAFGTAKNPGTQMEYRQVTSTIYWVDDPDSAYYNQWVDAAQTYPDWSSAEHLASMGDAYRYAIFIQYNMSPTTSGAGSAFFLHCSSNSSSLGCVQTDEKAMISYLKRLRDGAYISID